MTLWSNIAGTTPPVFDSDTGLEPLPDGEFYVAVSMRPRRIRITVRDESGEDGNSVASISLGPTGIAELHRRIVVARAMLDKSI